METLTTKPGSSYYALIKAVLSLLFAALDFCAKFLGIAVADIFSLVARAWEADDHLGTVLGCISQMVTRAPVCHLQTSIIWQPGQWTDGIFLQRLQVTWTGAGTGAEAPEPIFCHKC